MLNFIGVVTLNYEGEIFLVFWGNDPGAWSCVQTLESLRFVSDFAISSASSDENAADAIVQYMRQNETRVRDLMGILTTFPSIWGPSERQGAPQFVVGLMDRLAIRRSCTSVEFIDRKVPRMELAGRLLPKERSISSPRAHRIAPTPA